MTSVVFLLLYAGEHRGARDAGRGLQANRSARIVPQSEEELGDEETRAQGGIEREKMVHVRFERCTVLRHGAGLPELHQLMHLQLELLCSKFFADRGAEGVPPERSMSLTIRLKPVRCVSFDVERRRGHPVVWQNAVQVEVGDASIDPQVWGRAVEPWEVVLGWLGEVLVVPRRLEVVVTRSGIAEPGTVDVASAVS